MFDKLRKVLPSGGDRPRSRAARSPWTRRALCLLVLVLVPAPLPADAPADPAAWLGRWYVLVHYREEGEGSPGQEQGEDHWDDEIWRIEKKGPGLRWTIFPHPEFRDASGRWQTFPSGEEGRSAGAWVPGPGQLEEIASGLAYADQDGQSKRLRADGRGGWASAGSLRATSASQIGYHERWRIVSAGPGPIFERQAAMGSGRTAGVEAATRFVTREILAGGRELRGEYVRQGEGRGSFRMLRMAGAGEGGP